MSTISGEQKDMSFFGFHPVIEEWFQSRFAAPTAPQQLGWPKIVAGEHTLIAAPTGSGKTLTAFLSVIDRLLKLSLAGELTDDMHVVYVSPLRALSNDMHRNLEVPLREIMELAELRGLIPADQTLSTKNSPTPNNKTSSMTPIRAGLRTGDTSSSQRAKLVRRPPHILVTTPESLYLMLTAEKSREKLRIVDTVIIDEIHALVRDKRGSHLALSIERLAQLSEGPLQRIGLSATQKPIERMAEFLVGVGEDSGFGDEASVPDCRPAHTPHPTQPILPATNTVLIGETSCDTGSALLTPELVPAAPAAIPRCAIVDVGHGRDLDLAIETPPSELGAVCMHEQWAEVNARIVELIKEHRSTLIFVNTRRLAERVTHQLSEILGEDAVGSHHGSLSAEIRLSTEQRLKSGQLQAVVATASLELGLDVGYIDLVVQLGSPRSIATFLQRIGRSGHSLGLVPKGRLFALTRDELLECMALMRAIRGGRLDVIPIPEAPLDVLAQQIVAEVSAEEWSSDGLFDVFRRAYPYRALSREQFDRTVELLAEGITHNTGRSRVYLHHDQVQRRLRARKGARIAATTNAGAIPEIGSFRVVAEPEHTVVGTVDEDFAIESVAGSVFLLGNTSWRILYVRGGDVTVMDAQGAPPTIPFWRGEAPGRTVELSEEVSRLREELEQRVDEPVAAAQWLTEQTLCDTFAAEQTVEYAAAQKAAIGLLPTQRRVVFERFFDESGGMQMVVHAPFGSRINQAWALAMRKRFCRSFDFELQATADDDGFILSLGPQHSFPLESMFPMLTQHNLQNLLEQAVLAVPMFQVRWRWNVTRALLVMRRNNGKKVPPALQRFRADDLLTAVFPKLTGCQENVVGDIELPDHPLAIQTMHDCLHEALDVDGAVAVLRAVDRGDIEFLARDTREPSPFCYELLNANPYAFLDGGEIQERRARAVSMRRSVTVESVDDLGGLDPQAIEQVREEAQPAVRDADELHDALLGRIVLPVDEADGWQRWFDELVQQQRAASLQLPDGRIGWVAAERIPAAKAIFPNSEIVPVVAVPAGVKQDWQTIEARVALVRGLIETSGPMTAEDMSARTSITASQAFAALEALEGEGVVLRGRFTRPNDWPGAQSAGDELTTVNGASDEVSSDGEVEEATAANSSPTAPNTDEAADEHVTIEWCHRRLLARIHRLTLAGLRRQIEPVSVDVFLRFLLRHHGLLPATRRTGTNGLFEVVSMLQGIDVPAVSWERDLLPARLESYRSAWLDELCLTGEVGWGRLYPPKRDPERSKPMASLTRVAPISLHLRSDADWLTEFAPAGDEESLSSPSVEVCELLRRRGAMFSADLMNETRMLPAQLDEALGELVTRGLVTADGFAGLRQLIVEKTSNTRRNGPRRRPSLVRQRGSAGGSGRWSLWRPADVGESRDEAVDAVAGRVAGDAPADDMQLTPQPHVVSSVEQWAWQLLRRWGVVFRDLLIRESGAPRWFALLQVYRKLEARGEIRGGRFIKGVAGEQFALGETVRQLRVLRDDGTAPASKPQGNNDNQLSIDAANLSEVAVDEIGGNHHATDYSELVVVSAADPLNLVGILTKHSRIPSTAANRVVYWNGRPVAAIRSGELEELETLSTEAQARISHECGLLNRATGIRNGLTWKKQPLAVTQSD